ncbi:jg25437, partial [Pararge aegeria aegeria]
MCHSEVWQGTITLQHMELMDNLKNELKPNIVKTVLKPDHCDLYITHSDEDKQTENSTECNFVGEVAVKNEVSHDTMSTDNQTQPNQVKKDNGITANSFNPNIVILKEEYMSDDSITVEPKQFNDPLLVKPSTSKELVESLAQIKYEITFECTTCFVEFADEDTYNNHMAMHIQ